MLKGLIKYKFITILCLWSSLLSQDGKLRISILDFQGDGIDEQMLKICYNRLESKLIESNRFTVIAKAEREDLLKEWEWQSASGVCDEECAVEVGDMLGAQYLMVGGIIGSNDYYQINIKIVNISKGDILDSDERVVVGGLQELLDGMTQSSREITRKITLSSAPQQIAQQTGLPAAVQKSFGSIDVTTDPPGANIFIDGVEFGITPKTIPDLETGQHKLTLRYPGFETLQKGIMVEEEKTIAISEYLVAKTGRLSILSDPVGATVFLEDIVRGKTPLDINELPVKDYMIRLELNDYQMLEGRVTIQYGENTTQKYTLDPLPGKLNVYTDPMGVDIVVKDKRYLFEERYKSDASGILSVELPVGQYKLKMTKKGYEPKEKDIIINANDISEHDINLKKIPAGVSSNAEMGFLSVTSSDESVRLKIQGIKEIQQLPLEYYELIHGTYNLKAFGIGFESKKKSVVIERQKTTKVEINLNPKERAKAVRYSLMFPGGGQFYEGSKSRMRGFIYAGTFIGTGALLSQSISSYSDENKLLDQYQANYQAASSAADIDATWAIYEQQSATVNDAQTNLMILSTTLVSAYLTSIIDSYFFSDL